MPFTSTEISHLKWFQSPWRSPYLTWRPAPLACNPLCELVAKWLWRSESAKALWKEGSLHSPIHPPLQSLDCSPQTHKDCCCQRHSGVHFEPEEHSVLRGIQRWTLKSINIKTMNLSTYYKQTDRPITIINPFGGSGRKIDNEANVLKGWLTLIMPLLAACFLITPTVKTYLRHHRKYLSSPEPSPLEPYNTKIKSSHIQFVQVCCISNNNAASLLWVPPAKWINTR